jgi:hypothetical protein
LSVTLIGTKDTVAPLHVASDSTLIGHGQVIAGGCRSLTVTVNEQVAELLQASSTVQATVVVPFWKVDPDDGLHVATPTPEQLSLTVGVAHDTFAVQRFGAVFVVMFVGHVIVGGVMSFTVNICVHVA